MKRALRLVHKYLSLTLAALWLLQAVTGVLLVFHWELALGLSLYFLRRARVCGGLVS
jgi:uncharacterized iron-regulated membrane protein